MSEPEKDCSPTQTENDRCPTCKGTGLQEPHWANPQGKCRRCDGTGIRTTPMSDTDCGPTQTEEVWTIYRAHCTMCGQVKEFQSEAAARSYINEHQRSHNNAPINWTKP